MQITFNFVLHTRREVLLLCSSEFVNTGNWPTHREDVQDNEALAVDRQITNTGSRQFVTVQTENVKPFRGTQSPV